MIDLPDRPYNTQRSQEIDVPHYKHGAHNWSSSNWQHDSGHRHVEAHVSVPHPPRLDVLHCCCK